MNAFENESVGESSKPLLGEATSRVIEERRRKLDEVVVAFMPPCRRLGTIIPYDDRRFDGEDQIDRKEAKNARYS